MCKKILSFLLVGICLIATLTPIRALENSEDISEKKSLFKRCYHHIVNKNQF